MEDIFFRGWDNLVARVGGPLTFRLVLQPAVAVFLAVRSGVRDAREGRPVFFWTVVRDPARRRDLLRHGWRDVGKLFIVAVVLDVIYSLIVLRWVFVGQTLIVATTLALVPYLVVRGLTNRMASAAGARRTPDDKKDTDVSGPK